MYKFFVVKPGPKVQIDPKIQQQFNYEQNITSQRGKRNDSWIPFCKDQNIEELIHERDSISQKLQANNNEELRRVVSCNLRLKTRYERRAKDPSRLKKGESPAFSAGTSKMDIGLVLDLEMTNEMESPENPSLQEQGSSNDVVPQQTSTPTTPFHLHRWISQPKTDVGKGSDEFLFSNRQGFLHIIDYDHELIRIDMAKNSFGV
ncbi:hypothetical protein CEXT_165571 [Caerostris extrusa]|uniref:Uncharacterized protein n=1 Tax=Caerostris extrusa TaxID=172846 RepID=A0AAV4RIU5_CAEEX|nr:hypothetical protein CEXT_165571 [Caerostris extrusa]